MTKMRSTGYGVRHGAGPSWEDVRVGAADDVCVMAPHATHDRGGDGGALGYLGSDAAEGGHATAKVDARW